MEATLIKNQGQENSIAMAVRIREPILKRNSLIPAHRHFIPWDNVAQMLIRTYRYWRI